MDFEIKGEKSCDGCLKYYDIVLNLIRNNGLNLEFVTVFKNNKEVVFEAVHQNGLSLRYASNILKNNKQIVLEAVQNKGESLKYASKELQNNKEIVLEAMRNGSLEYASNELKDDFEIVLEAVKTNGFFIYDVSLRLKRNFEIIYESIQNLIKNQRSMKYYFLQLSDDYENNYLTSYFFDSKRTENYLISYFNFQKLPNFCLFLEGFDLIFCFDKKISRNFSQI
jgi:hypothetical protein